MNGQSKDVIVGMASGAALAIGGTTIALCSAATGRTNWASLVAASCGAALYFQSIFTARKIQKAIDLTTLKEKIAIEKFVSSFLRAEQIPRHENSKLANFDILLKKYANKFESTLSEACFWNGVENYTELLTKEQQYFDEMDIELHRQLKELLNATPNIEGGSLIIEETDLFERIDELLLAHEAGCAHGLITLEQEYKENSQLVVYLQNNKPNVDVKKDSPLREIFPGEDDNFSSPGSHRDLFYPPVRPRSTPRKTPKKSSKTTPRKSRDDESRRRPEDESRRSPKDDESESSSKENESKSSPIDDESEKSAKGDESERSPKDDESERSPKDDESERSPKDDESERSPKDDESERSPKDDESERSPKDDESERSPKDDESERSPKDDKAERSPRNDELERSPKGDESEIPAKGDESEISAKGDESEISAKGDKSEISAKGDESEISAKCDESERSPKGNESERSLNNEESETSPKDEAEKSPKNKDSSEQLYPDSPGIHRDLYYPPVRPRSAPKKSPKSPQTTPKKSPNSSPKKSPTNSPSNGTNTF